MENHYYNIGGDNLITINATMSQIIKIGHQGENKAVQVAFDLTPFQSSFPGGRPQLVVRRPGDQSGYPVALIVDGSQAIWIVSASDTEKSGRGQCELQWFVGDTLAKSDKYNVLIYSSIPGDAVPPDAPSKAWFEKILSDIGDLSALDTESKENLVAAINEARQTGGGGTGGTNDHTNLSNRDAADQHPIGAITGLVAALDGKQPAGSYLTEESDPTVPAWAKTEKKPSYTAQEVGADPSGTAAGLVSSHNTAEAAHNDIRLLISGLTDRLNALADSDDTTLDQFSEVVAYIKANRELIASITTDKVSVTDIVNDLVTNVTNKPLSAAQGVALKALIDAISIPTALPNPNALTFTGAATGSYDGSAPLSVEIPSGGGASGDYIPIPASAEVGQTIVVKAVDENGKPTEWEAVDLPSGGGQAIDKITIKITETVHSISLLDDITLYNRIRANIKVVGDSANAASGVLGAITPSGMLVNYILNTTKTATGYLFFDLRLSEQGAESDVTPNFSNQAYTAAALSHVYGLNRTRWTGALSLAPNSTDWNFGAGTEIYLEAYRA